MENKKHISVILASYNHAAYIDEAVRSVLNQGIEGLELIVVDDGSTDGTPDLVEQINDPCIRLIRLAENRRFHPRNTGLAAASGKYIAFQNSDDVWKPGKLKKQLDILENARDLSACFTGVEIIGAAENMNTGSWPVGIFTEKNMEVPDWLRHFFYYGNCLCLPSVVVRRLSLEQAGYFKSELIQLSDLDLWIRLAAAGGFHIIGEKLTQMRVVPGKNMSSPDNFSAAFRSAVEMAEVLERYTQAPIAGRLHEIFPEEIPAACRSKAAVSGSLALMAWKLSASHVLFANKIMSELVGDAGKREELAGMFGTQIIQKFYEMRGCVEISRARSLPVSDKKILSWLKQTVKKFLWKK